MIRRGTALAAASGAAVVAVFAQFGADVGWATELGRLIVVHRSIPDGVPFAGAPSGGFPNPLVGGETVLGLLWDGLGGRGLLLGQAAAAATAFAVVAADARAAGARGIQTAAALVLVVLGGLSTLAVIRIQLFSVAAFPCLVYLLRAESRSPSWRVWLIVPLVALWANLHGGVVLGTVVAATYLVIDRARSQPATALPILALLVPALCATPALYETVSYYARAFGNAGAERGIGLWARPSLHSTFDLLLLISAAALVALAVRARPRPWELLCLFGLSVATLLAARNGFWLLLFAAPRAAAAVPRWFAPELRGHLPTAALAAAAVTAFGYGVASGPLNSAATDRLIQDALGRAGGGPILASPAIAEQIILAKGRIWIANPLEAFRHRDQERYLDWLDGRPSGDALLSRVSVVATQAGSPPALRLARDRRFVVSSSDGAAILFVRRR